MDVLLHVVLSCVRPLHKNVPTAWFSNNSFKDKELFKHVESTCFRNSLPLNCGCVYVSDWPTTLTDLLLFAASVLTC